MLLIAIFLSNVAIQATPFEELREAYMEALHDSEKAPEVYELFLKEENPSAKVLAYRGALEAIMTRTTWNVFKKINYLKLSEKSFQEAVKKDPNNIEIRFMRMAVQYEIPEYLGFSENLEEDKKFVVEHIYEFEAQSLPKSTLKEIFSFMKRCNYFSPNQIETFKDALSLNSN